VQTNDANLPSAVANQPSYNDTLKQTSSNVSSSLEIANISVLSKESNDVSDEATKLQKEIATLQTNYANATAEYTELEQNYKEVNRQLEQLGQISPQQLANYLPAPFDLHVARFNKTEFVKFEAFYRAKDDSEQANEYERLILAFFENPNTEYSGILKQVDCKKLQCKLYLKGEGYEALGATVSAMGKQAWASDLIQGESSSYVREYNGTPQIEFIFNYYFSPTGG
jgi:hypothetical protein